MSEIGARLIERDDAKVLSGRTSAEAAELREDEPHPVALLRSGAKLTKRGFVHAVLGGNETLEVERIGHAGIMALGSPAGKAARAY